MENKLVELKVCKDHFDKSNNFKIEGVRMSVALYQGYNKEDDGIYYGSQECAIIKNNYTEADVAHREHMKNYTPLKNGQEVLIDGKVYILKINGDYSNCCVFIEKQ